MLTIDDGLDQPRESVAATLAIQPVGEPCVADDARQCGCGWCPVDRLGAARAGTKSSPTPPSLGNDTPMSEFAQRQDFRLEDLAAWLESGEFARQVHRLQGAAGQPGGIAVDGEQ